MRAPAAALASGKLDSGWMLAGHLPLAPLWRRALPAAGYSGCVLVPQSRMGYEDCFAHTRAFIRPSNRLLGRAVMCVVEMVRSEAMISSCPTGTLQSAARLFDQDRGEVKAQLRDCA